MNTYVVGDIHGNLKALYQVFERSPFNPDKDKIIFLGDYVDGHSQSAEVIDLLVYLKSIMGDRCICILGNHDEWCKEWLIYGSKNPNWLPQGGQATYNSYIRTLLFTEESHRKFFRTLQYYYIDDNNRVFVHGGFRSVKGIGNDAYSTYIWDRTMWDGTLAYSKSGHPLGYELFGINKHKEIFIGHTTTMSHRDENYKRIDYPMNAFNIWNVDTGAGMYGRLTIMDINTKEYWQSDLCKDLY